MSGSVVAKVVPTQKTRKMESPFAQMVVEWGCQQVLCLRVQEMGTCIDRSVVIRSVRKVSVLKLVLSKQMQMRQALQASRKRMREQPAVLMVERLQRL